MNRIARNELYEGRFVPLDELVRRVDRVLSSDVQRVASELISGTVSRWWRSARARARRSRRGTSRWAMPRERAHPGPDHARPARVRSPRLPDRPRRRHGRLRGRLGAADRAARPRGGGAHRRSPRDPAGLRGPGAPRSGLALRHGIGIPNGPGTIDSDYRGELQVLLINFGSEPYVRAARGSRGAAGLRERRPGLPHGRGGAPGHRAGRRRIRAQRPMRGFARAGAILAMGLVSIGADPRPSTPSTSRSTCPRA